MWVFLGKMHIDGSFLAALNNFPLPASGLQIKLKLLKLSLCGPKYPCKKFFFDKSAKASDVIFFPSVWVDSLVTKFEAFALSRTEWRKNESSVSLTGKEGKKAEKRKKEDAENDSIKKTKHGVRHEKWMITIKIKRERVSQQFQDTVYLPQVSLLQCTLLALISCASFKHLSVESVVFFSTWSVLRINFSRSSSEALLSCCMVWQVPRTRRTCFPQTWCL